MVPKVGAEIDVPYHEDLRDLPPMSYRDELIAVVDSPVLHGLTKSFDALDSGSRRAAYPPLLQYAVAVAARIHGSQRRALTELRAPGVWKDICAAYNSRLDEPVPLPLLPPTEAQQDGFIARVCERPGVLERLSKQFTVIAVGQARYLGNFADGVLPDHAKPDSHHLVMGDGTYVKPFSDVTEVVDPVTGELFRVGSRATKQRPRMQQRFTNPKPDQKTAHGINHVTLTTWTDAGWVVLALAHAYGGEVHQARELVGRVHDLLGARLHTVVWDRVLQGMDVQRLMAERRLLVVTKPVSRRRTSNESDGHRAARLTEEEARRRFATGEPLPLGTSVYERTAPTKPEVTRSSYFRYQTRTLDGCRHDLWVDAGALVDVQADPASGWLVKVGHATALQAVPLPDLDGPFTLPIRWRLPCPAAPTGHHTFETLWTPNPSSAGRPRAGAQRALYDLRPIPRLNQDAFAKVHGLRNITESFNAWFKRSLGDNRRAMHLDVRAQLLDHLCAATLANARTLQQFERLQALSRAA